MKDLHFDALIRENEILASELFESRRIALGLLMAFIHISAESSDAPTSWLLSYLVNNDRGVLSCEETSEWPPGYLENVEDFFELIAFYIGHDAHFPPVIQSTQIMKDWPFKSPSKKTLH